MDTYGVKTDPAILLIHGAGNTRYAWHEDFCKRLAGSGRFVIRHDFAGAGVDAWVQEALRVLDDRAHVVGLSLGGDRGDATRARPSRARVDAHADVHHARRRRPPGQRRRRVRRLAGAARLVRPSGRDRVPRRVRATVLAALRRSRGARVRPARRRRCGPGAHVRRDRRSTGASRSGRASARWTRPRSWCTAPPTRCSRSSTARRSRRRSRVRPCSCCRRPGTSIPRAGIGTRCCGDRAAHGLDAARGLR